MIKIKRITALGLAAVMLVSSLVSTVIINATADSGEQASGTAPDSELIYESDYNDVTNWDGYSTTSYNANWSNSLAGNAFPRVVDGNGYISYTQNSFTLGVIRLGHDYKTKDIGEYTYVEAVPGRTYVIEYDTKVYANTYAKSTETNLAQGWPQGGADMFVGIAVANPTKSIEDIQVTQYLKDTKDYVSYYQTVDTIQRNTNPDSSKWEGNVNGWVHKTVEFKVPKDLDVSVNNALQIYMGNGSRCELSIDNIKVSWKVTSDDALFESNYNDVTNWDGYSATSFDANWSNSLAGNAFPRVADGNGYISYTQNSWTLGVIRLGHSYRTKDIGTYEYVKAVPGKTYVIEYDTKVYASTVALSTPERLAQGWPLGGADMFVGIAVANPTKSVEGKQVTQYLNGNGDFASYYQTVDTIQRNSNPDSSKWEGNVNGWVHKTVEFKVPDDLDASVNNALQIFIGNGQRCEMSFDNIKVYYKSDDGGDGELLADNDYSTAYTSADRPSKYFTTAASDVLPVKDPDNPVNTILEVKKQTSDWSYVYLGAGYNNKGEVTANSITAEPKTAYEIEFDYKITELDAAQSVNAFDIGICLVGPNTIEPDDKTWGNNRVNSNQQLFITKETVKATEGWEKHKQVYIVPSDADLSQTNKLAILCKVSTKRYAIYFDNVKVRKINFTYTLKFDTAGGEEIEPLAGAKGEEYTLPQTAVKEGCIFLGWYEDKDFKTPASDGVFEEEVKTIYAKFKKLQYIQGFEEEWAKFPVVRSDWFEYAFWYNTTADPGSRKSWAQWTAPGLAYEYNSDGVRSGQGSVYTPGLNAYTKLFTLFLKDPLVVGEKYTLSFWVKLIDYTLPGNFELWFNNGDWNSGKLRTPVDWGSGARSAIVINTSTMRENKEEWIEVKFEFTALGKFMGIGVPGLTECYIDDARITDESADKSYIRTTEGKGKKFEDWYSQSGADDDKYVPIEEKDDPIIIRYVALEGIDADFNTGTNDNYSNNDDNTNYQDNDNTNGNNDSKQSGGKKTVRVKMKKKKTQTDTENSSTFPVWLIVIVGVSVLAVAAGAVSAVVITKKRKSSSK